MSYAGDLSPQEAWAKLEDGAILVDVRTEGEWAHIGIPDTTSAGGTAERSALHPVEPRRRPPQCAVHRTAESSRPPTAQGTELVFLCRSGARSIAAAIAATEAGFTSYNVLEGFEGEPDRHGDRTVNGWKNRGLPTNPGKH